MPLPPLLALADEPAYRSHFEAVYCQAPVFTFDSIGVRFRKCDFDHCCFESNRSTRLKEIFSPVRAERLNWIGAALQDPNAALYVGWDNHRKRYDQGRRVCVVSGNYVVVISLIREKEARFVTAFLADTPRTIDRIHKSPLWK